MLRGQVWEVDFNPSKGDEIKKIRRAVIVSSDKVRGLRVRTVVPITDVKNNVKEWHYELSPTNTNGLVKDSVADCNQIKSMSTTRFKGCLGELSEEEMIGVQITLMKVLELV